MIYPISQTAYVGFTTNAATGAAANADSLPTASLVRNGTADGAVTVTVTNLSTGAYMASFAVPADYATNDDLQVLVSATVSTLACKLWIGQGRVDATVASRSTLAAADVWAAGTRTLTGFGTLVTDIWAAGTRTLTSIVDSSGVTTLLARLTSTRAGNLDNLDAPVSDMVVSALRGPLEIYLDGPADMRMAGDVIYVSETPTLILRVLDKAKESVAVGSSVTARLTRTDTGAAVPGTDIACTVRDASLGIVELQVPTESSDATLAGKRLNLTLAWVAGGRTHVAGAFTLEVKAR